MKPATPPPPAVPAGRALPPDVLEALREDSGVALSADGVFRYRGHRVPNDRVQALFHRGLRVRPDGRVTLRVGHQWCYVQADGVARFIAGLAVVEGGLRVRTSAGEVVCAPPGDTVLGVGPDERFYVWAPRDAPPAVLLRGAHQQLAGLLDLAPAEAPGGSERLILVVGSVGLPVHELSDVPAPNAPAPH